MTCRVSDKERRAFALLTTDNSETISNSGEAPDEPKTMETRLSTLTKVVLLLGRGGASTFFVRLFVAWDALNE